MLSSPFGAALGGMTGAVAGAGIGTGLTLSWIIKLVDRTCQKLNNERLYVRTGSSQIFLSSSIAVYAKILK